MKAVYRALVALIPVMLVSVSAQAAEWKLVSESKDLKTGTPMVQLNQLTREESFEDCSTWAKAGGGLGLTSEAEIAGQGTMLFVSHKSEGMTLGCQKVMGTLIQYFLQVPKAMAAEKGLLPEGG
jgi:hypothetical protein